MRATDTRQQNARLHPRFPAAAANAPPIGLVLVARMAGSCSGILDGSARFSRGKRLPERADL